MLWDHLGSACAGGGAPAAQCAAGAGVSCAETDVLRKCVGCCGADRAEMWVVLAARYGLFVEEGRLEGASGQHEAVLASCVGPAGGCSPVGWDSLGAGSRCVEQKRAAGIEVACIPEGTHEGAGQVGEGRSMSEAGGTALVVQEFVQGLAWEPRAGTCTVGSPPCEGAECSLLKQEAQGCGAWGRS